MSDDATTMTTADSAHPCLSCGACCASFRVDFAVYEMQAMGGTVPDGLALDVNGSTCRMRGTEQVPIRCADRPGGSAGGVQHLRTAPRALPRVLGGRLRLPQGACAARAGTTGGRPDSVKVAPFQQPGYCRIQILIRHEST